MDLEDLFSKKLLILAVKSGKDPTCKKPQLLQEKGGLRKGLVKSCLRSRHKFLWCKLNRILDLQAILIAQGNWKTF